MCEQRGWVCVNKMAAPLESPHTCENKEGATCHTHV